MALTPHPIEADIIVLGAGLLGSSVAMHLADQIKNQHQTKSILVLDMDLEGQFSSSELNAGGVRALWNNPLNTKLSKISIQYFADVASEIGFRQKGYFWMYSKDEWKPAVEKLKSNKDLMSNAVEFLEPAQITKKFDFIDKVDDLGGAVYSTKDGLLNPNLLKLHYRHRAREMAVKFMDHVWVEKAVPGKNGVELTAKVFDKKIDSEKTKEILIPKSQPVSANAEPIHFKCETLVNCSGPWAKYFYESLKLKPVSFPLRRQACIFDCKTVDLTQYGMFIDPSGVYFHPEANSILAGYADPTEKPGYNFDYDGEAFFQEKIWLPLFERSTHFESLKHVTGWGGLYEISLDKSAIIGKMPGVENVYEAHSFSGRGVMQSYAAGLALSELILTGSSKTIPEIEAFSASRFEKGQTIQESLLI